ncbi:MAG: polysaccharide deacetylase family protein [Acidobacteriaceae bacterium]|nr:polysaccharide deacetylase family protein [Acidobacteriaceae bacterium]
MLRSVVSVAGAAAAACAAGYQTMSPTGQWYGRTFVGLPRGAMQLALTYDDGPNDPHTLRLLEILAKHEVHATFFLIGKYVKLRPDLAREILKAGHAIGNHTFSHPNLIFASARRTRRELETCSQVIQDALGTESLLFRPPFGGRRPGTLRVARSLGLEPIMWRVTGYDWQGKAAQYVEQKVRSQVRGGDVILLHDGSHVAFGADRAQTLIATDHLISWCKSQGSEFLTIPQMLGRTVPSNQFSVLSRD